MQSSFILLVVADWLVYVADRLAVQPPAAAAIYEIHEASKEEEEHSVENPLINIRSTEIHSSSKLHTELSSPMTTTLKFLNGLTDPIKDLLGFHDSAAGPSSPSTVAAPIPPTTTFSPSTPTKTKKSIEEANFGHHGDNKQSRCSHDKNVSFSELLITGYSSAPQSPMVRMGGLPECMKAQAATSTPICPDEIIQNYRRVCEKAKIVANKVVERQIGYFHRFPLVRQEELSVKGERMSFLNIEALEEIFKRVQFESLDFEYTFLDDDGLISLSEMLEFYESAHKLNLSFNRQINPRGWGALFKAVRNCHSLQVLNLRYTSVEKGLSHLCRCLKTQPMLACLHLENVGMSGKNLSMLVGALKLNNTLKELYLGDNSMTPSDGAHLNTLIMYNNTLQMLDLRNNELGDVGVKVMCEALKHPDTAEHSSLTAIVLWNNRITHDSMDHLSQVLVGLGKFKEEKRVVDQFLAGYRINNPHVETLNIGCNNLGHVGVDRLKEAISQSANLHRLGLQNTKMNCEAAILLAECLADNTAMVRVDLRDNPSIGSAGLLALHSAMKMNHSITLMNIDQTCAIPASEKVREYQDEFRRYFDEITVFCERNKKAAMERLVAKTTDEDDMVIVNKEEIDEAVNAVPGDSCAPCSSHSSVCSEPLSPSSEAANPPLHVMAPIVAKKQKRFVRSTSLTCEEHVTDLPERIREMSGSTMSLDESNSDSMRTIKRFQVTNYEPLTKAAWGSLPALPQAPPETTPQPVVRKLRRFSVSPSSSTFDVSKPAQPSTSTIPELSRPKTLAVSIPTISCEGGSSSAPASSSLPDCWSNNQAPTVHSAPSTSTFRVTVVPATLTVPGQQQAPPTGSPRKISTDSIDYVVESEEEMEREVKTVVTDLVNYVCYEERSQVERKASILLGTSPFAEVSASGSAGNTPSTPSRMLLISEELSQEAEDDETVVSSVVRRMVRQVMQNEKDQLSLERKKRSARRSLGGPGSVPGTPV